MRVIITVAGSAAYSAAAAARSRFDTAHQSRSGCEYLIASGYVVLPMAVPSESSHIEVSLIWLSMSQKARDDRSFFGTAPPAYRSGRPH